MNSESKADKIRKMLADKPTASADEIAKTIKCNPAYVYLVKSKMKSKPTQGQQVLRNHISSEGKRIADLEDQIKILRGQISVLKNVIWYLQHGSAI